MIAARSLLADESLVLATRRVGYTGYDKGMAKWPTFRAMTITASMTGIAYWGTGI
jgi:hypothetical protein